MNLYKKKVLVTGSDGFIGSHLVESLVENGADVRAFVFYNSFLDGEKTSLHIYFLLHICM